MAETQLGMFAKYPQPGKVKTRLAASIGDTAAAHVYRAFVETLLERFADSADRRVLAYSPPERHDEFEALLGEDSSWELQPQSTGDLGQRMRRYFNAGWASNTPRVVLIGSDSPTLPAEFVQQAFDLLQCYPIVLGPSDDGGYYLLGLRDEVPPIFDGISWSSDAVWQETIARLAAAGIGYAKLPAWYDVDDLDDLDRLRAELSDATTRDEFSKLRRLLDDASEQQK